ncbi:MAG TPA: flippase [Acidimicrobiia bacterium]|nr:flippase [Acidimicrobiia bacterium]
MARRIARVKRRHADRPRVPPPPGSVGRGATGLLIGRTVSAIAGWTGTVVIARQLSPSDWGGYSFIFGLLGIIGLVVDLQVGRIVLREVLDAGDDAGRVVGSYTMLRLLIGLVAYIAAVAIVIAGGYEREIVLGTLVAGFGFLLIAPANGLAIWFEARIWLRPSAVATILGAITQLGFTLLVAMASGSNLVMFAAASTVGQLVVFGWRVRAVFAYHLSVHPNLDPGRWWAWLREAIPLAIGFGLVTIYYKLDIVMLSKLDTLEAVGQYSIGYKFADLASYVPLALLTPLLALMVAAWPHDTQSLRSHFRQAFVLLFVAATALTVGFACIAQPAVELLYGTRYAPAVDAARYLVAGAAIQFFSYLCFTTLVSVGRNRPYALAGLAGVVINATLNFVLIPRYSFNGSAVATVITEVIVSGVLLTALTRTRGIVTIPVGVILRTALAGAAMAGVYVALVPFVPWPAAALVAAATFLALLHLLGADGPGGLRTLVRNARFDSSAVQPGARPPPDPDSIHWKADDFIPR